MTKDEQKQDLLEQIQQCRSAADANKAEGDRLLAEAENDESSENYGKAKICYQKAKMDEEKADMLAEKLSKL